MYNKLSGCFTRVHVSLRETSRAVSPVYQIGAEACDRPNIDAELIGLGWACWQALGIESMFEINTLGWGARQQYRSALVSYLSPLVDQLDEDSRRRLDTNPMRILDSKNPETQRLLENAPMLPDFVERGALRRTMA